MREIPLTQGQVALVDAADYGWLNQWKWYAFWNKNTRSFYAARGAYSNGAVKTTFMHRVIVGAGRSELVDHVEPCKTLDNRRSNLRIATYSQNSFNSRIRSNNTSGYKGASLDKSCGKWRASICINSKKRFIGYLSSPELAHEAYKLAAAEHHGEFARFA
jgi:hypothetical protein